MFDERKSKVSGMHVFCVIGSVCMGGATKQGDIFEHKISCSFMDEHILK